jgi:hypothetical protein
MSGTGQLIVVGLVVIGIAGLVVFATAFNRKGRRIAIERLLVGVSLLGIGVLGLVYVHAWHEFAGMANH